MSAASSRLLQKELEHIKADFSGFIDSVDAAGRHPVVAAAAGSPLLSSTSTPQRHPTRSPQSSGGSVARHVTPSPTPRPTVNSSPVAARVTTLGTQHEWVVSPSTPIPDGSGGGGQRGRSEVPDSLGETF